MPKIDLMEGEEVEFKQQWTDRALEDLAAFANTRGGTLLIGVRKDGEVVGAAADEAEIERIANVVVSRLGLTPSIRRRTVGGRNVIAVQVERARGVVGYGGRYVTCSRERRSWTATISAARCGSSSTAPWNASADCCRYGST